MNQQGAVPKIHQSMVSPPLGHEPPQSRRRNPLTPFGPAGQYRLTNGWPWCSRLATAKGESVYEDFALSATVDFLFAPAGYALARLKFRLTTRRELAGVLPNPRRADDRPSGNHPWEQPSFWAPPASPQGRGRQGSTPFTSPKALGTSMSHSSRWRFPQCPHTWQPRTCNSARASPPPEMGASTSSNFRNVASTPQGTWMGTGGPPFAKSCPRHWGSWIPPTGRYRPGCGIPRCRTNRETADSCPTVAARWSPLLQMMIGMVRGRSGTPDS